jgi:hypothetical protein
MSEPLTDVTTNVPTPQLVEAADPYAEWEPDEDDLLDLLAMRDDEDERGDHPDPHHDRDRG